MKRGALGSIGVLLFASISACQSSDAKHSDAGAQRQRGDAAAAQVREGGALSDGPGADGTPTDAADDVDAPPMLTATTKEALAALSPDELPAPPRDISNSYADDAAAAALGKQFFFDPGFSGALIDSDNIGDITALGQVGESGKVACSGCHLPKSGFLDSRSVRQTVSLAAGWGHRRTPSLLDVGQAAVVMWDGRHDALFNQPFGALESGVEMNSSRLYAAEQIFARYRAPYEAVFGPITAPLDDAKRFPRLSGATTGCRKLSVTRTGIFSGFDCHGVPGDGAEFDQMTAEDQDAVTRVWTNVGKAIAAYERLLSCGPSRFDQWMHGDAKALSTSEQRGAALFVGQRQDGSTFTGCNTCHSGPFLTDQAFHNVGLEPAGVGPAASFVDVADKGAFDGLTAALADPLNVSGRFSDGDDHRLPAKITPNLLGAFRTPGLRCVALRPSLMHTGQLRSEAALATAVDFFGRGGSSRGYEGTNELTPLGLTQPEKDDLVAFLRALTGPGPSDELKTPPALP